MGGKPTLECGHLPLKFRTANSHQAFNGTAPNLTYTPAENYLGDDSFTYKASDGSADSNVSTVAITVTDASAPTVTRVAPSEDARDVPIGISVEGEFSEAIDEATLAGSVTLRKEEADVPVDAGLDYDPATDIVVLDPEADLEFEATYVATIKGGSAGVKDRAANALAADKVWRFTTGAAPDVTPPDTDINLGPSGPTNDVTPTFSFSGSDNVTASSDLLYSYKVDEGPWSEYSANTSAKLGGTTGLGEGSHSFYVKAMDQAGNEDGSPAQRSFTVDTTAPRVTGTTPTGARVERNIDVTAIFSEEMNRDALSESTFKLHRINTDRTATQLTEVRVTLSTDGLKATLDPFGTSSTLLEKNAVYMAEVTTEAKDVANNPLDQDSTTTGNQSKRWIFTTGSK